MRVQFRLVPEADMTDGEWRSPLCDAQGRLIVVLSSGGGGGAGPATEAKQDAQITQFATIISNTTGAALDATVLLVRDAVDAIRGSGAEVSTIYDVLTELQTRGAVDTAHFENIAAATSEAAITLDSLLGSSQTIETYTDNLETLITETNTKLNDVKTAVEAVKTAVETAQAEATRFAKPPSIWKKYATIPGGGLDLATEFPGKSVVRIETYGDGLLNMRPTGDAGNVVSADSFYGWTWLVDAAKIEDTTTALPLFVYWS